MPHSAFFSADYTLSVPSRRSSPTSSSSSSSEPVTPVGSTVDAPPPYLAEHQSSPYDSMRSSLAVATPHDDSPLGLIAKGHQLQADYFPTLPPHQSSFSSTSNEGRAHKSAYSPGSGKDRRKAPSPIAIATRRQSSTFSFPASPTENDVSPLTITIPRRSPGPSTTALVIQFPAPPNLTPPLSPTHDVAPAVPRPRRQSTAPSSSRVSMRKSSLVDGQLISAPPYAPDFGSHSSSPAFDKASVGSAPAAPRRMSIVGSGTRRRSSTGHGHPGSTGYASFSSCINGALAHEKKAATYEDMPQGPNPKALHHFNRSFELLELALEQKPGNLEATIYKAGVALVLSRQFLPPSEALRKAQAALVELRFNLNLDPESVSRNLHIAAQVQIASLTALLAFLSEGLHLSMVPRAIWAGEVGELARDAVRLWEGVVSAEEAIIREGFVPEQPGSEGGAEAWDEEETEELVNRRIAERERRGSSICHRHTTQETLVESHISLGGAAQFAAMLAPNLLNSDKYFDVAERALENAYRSALALKTGVAAGPRMSAQKLSPPPVTSASPLMYQVYLRFGPCKMERLRHTIEVGSQLPLNHALARTILGDMSKVAGDLSTIARGRSAEVDSLGLVVSETFTSKREAKPLAVQALTQLGDAQYLFAHLLKRTWKRRSSLKSGAIRRTASQESLPVQHQASPSPRSSMEVETASTPVDNRRSSLEDRRRASSISRRESFVDKHTIVEEESEEEKADSSPTRRCTSSEGTCLPQRCNSYSANLSRSMLTQAMENRKSSLPAAALTFNFSPSQPSNYHRSTSSLSFNPPLTSPTGHRPSWMSQASDSAVSNSSRMSMAQYRRISAAGSLRSVHSDDDLFGSMTGVLSSSPAALNIAVRRRSSQIQLVHASLPVPAAEDASLASTLTTGELAEQAWNLLSAAMKDYKEAFALLRPSRSDSSSAPSTSSLAYQRATILLSVSMSAYFRASLAPRIPAAKDSRAALLVSAEVYSTWAAREVGWEWLVEDQPRPEDFVTPFQSDRPFIVSKHAAIGQRAIFTLLRTVWHRAVTGEPGEVSKEDKRAAKARVETVVGRLRAEAGCGAYDITRFKVLTEKFEGEFEQGESLFWGGLSRTLKGSA